MLSFYPFGESREASRRKEAAKLLQKAEFEESLKREEVLHSSFNTSIRNTEKQHGGEKNHKAFEHSYKAVKANVSTLLASDREQTIYTCSKNNGNHEVGNANKSVILQAANEQTRKYDGKIDGKKPRLSKCSSRKNYESVYSGPARANIRCNNEPEYINPHNGSVYMSCDTVDLSEWTHSFLEEFQTSDVETNGMQYRSNAMNQNALLNVHELLCNIFWKSSLTFHPFKYGDAPVNFGSLWPSEEKLRPLLLDTVQEYPCADNPRLLHELRSQVVHCGPLRLLKVLHQLYPLSVTTEMLDTEMPALHQACVSQNLEAVLYLTTSTNSTKVKDNLGKTADKVCFSSQIQKVLPDNRLRGGYHGKSKGSPRNTVNEISDKQAPTNYDRQLIFELAESPEGIDELLLKLQTLDFDLNKEVNEYGDGLVHVAVKQGVRQVQLLVLLVRTFGANINAPNLEGLTCLMLAAMDGDCTIVDMLLCVLGADPDTHSPHTGWTALHHAAVKHHANVVSLLLKRGADSCAEDLYGAHPNDLATRAGATDCHAILTNHIEMRISHLLQMVKEDQLQVENLSPSDLYMTDSEGYTLLMGAARYNSCQSLQGLILQPGAPVDAQHGKTLKTALAFACRWGHVQAVRLLMRAGANPLIRDIERNLPLHNAVIHHQNAAAVELMEYPQALTGLQCALKLAASTKMKKNIQDAMHRRQRELVVPCLFQCAVSGEVAPLYELLEAGDCVTSHCGLGDTPLYLAVDNGHIEIIKVLVQYGACVTATHSQSGDTLLHTACSRGDLQITKYILNSCKECESKQNVDWNPLNPHSVVHVLNYKKKSALMVAAERGYLQIVKLLLDNGATTSVLLDTQSLYQCHQYHGVQYEIETYRLRHTHAVWLALKHRRALHKLKQVFLPRFDHNLRSAEGDTPLMAACFLGKEDVVGWLLQSAVYEVPPPPNHNSSKSSRCGGDSDVDSGAVCDGIHVLSNNHFQNQWPPPPSGSPPTSPLPSQVLSHRSGQAANTKIPDKPIVEPKPPSVEMFHEEPPEPVADPKTLIPSRESCNKLSQMVPPGYYDDIEDNGSVEGNISNLLESIASLSRGSIYTNEKDVSHLSAVSERDGATAYHRCIRTGDQRHILDLLLAADHSAVNIQDTTGISPLHLACKLGRSKCINILTSQPCVDLNSRTLDGKLPEELCTQLQLAQVVSRSREQRPPRRPSGLRSLPTSLFGTSSLWDEEETDSIDFEQINTQFMLIKHNIGSFDAYL